MPGPSKKRSRWKQRKPEEWKKNLRKKACSRGEKHLDEKGKMKMAKLMNPLINHSHKEPTNYKCSLFTEEDRLEIFNDYWKKRDTFKAKRNFLLKFTKAIPVKRRRSEKEVNFRKNLAYEYVLPKNNENLKVCREFFCATLAISYKPIALANKDRSNTGEFLGEDQRGKHEPHNKLKPEVIAAIKNHIESFPPIESHYCRKSSKRLYLSSGLSISKMFDLFKEKAAGTDSAKVSYEKYKQVFGQDYNMAFHKPKKDLYATCTLAQSAIEPSEEQKSDFEAHIKRKELSRAAMRSDIESCAMDKELIVATMDLQSVLQIPQAEASPFYYKRKLCVYNFTVYNEATRDGTCYIWSEVDGKRGSSEIGSCVKTFIEGEMQKGYRKIVLWSDNCSGQNRNRYVAAMLLQLVQESPIEIIKQNFLEVGHTQMDVDSMHSAIEHSAKNCSLFSMNDWSNVIRQARRKHPYHVVRMSHSDFIDLKLVSARSMKKVIVFNDGEKLNWLNIKSLMFCKSMPGQIGVKYNHDEQEYKVRKQFICL